MPEPARPDDWINGYLNGELTAEDHRALEDWLLEDEAQIERLARAVLLDSQLRSMVISRQLQGGLSVLEERGGSDEDLQAVDQDIMSELVDEALAQRRRREIEEAANTTLIADRGRSADKGEPLRLGPALRIVAASMPVLWLGFAAVLALAVTLFFVFQADPTSPQDVVETPGQDEPNPRVLAALTAERGAVWDQEPGEELYAGDRLTLTQGFAEITTARGAVVILEAPSTIEVLDDHSVGLHVGRLVGLCHTESSRGFVVRTNHAEITDLGTEFGVTAGPDGVEATVFVGEVSVKAGNLPPKLITHSQTARVTIGHDKQPALVIEDKPAGAYTQRLPRPALVTSASISLPGFNVEVVPQGVFEDAKIYTDRDHEMNGVDQNGLPTALLGGDLIRTPASARPNVTADVGDRLQIGVEVSRPADVYILFQTNPSIIGDWLERDYEPTPMRVGLDLAGAGVGVQYRGGRGPGVSVERVCEVWKRKRPVTGRATIGGPIGGTMYYFVVLPAEEDP